MNDVTETLWLILMTPQKNLLARLSCLKHSGKIKIDQLRVAYARKKTGGWGFEILSEPLSKTFSFHDGDVVQKMMDHYVPLRRYGLAHIFWTLVIISLGCAAIMVRELEWSPRPAMTKEPSPITELPAAVAEKKEVRVGNQNRHLQFLEAKRKFQSGEMGESIRTLRKNFDAWTDTDRKQAAEMISQAYYLECQSWIKEHEQRKAVVACEKAIAFQQNKGSEDFLALQEEKSRKLFLEGYTVQKFNPEVAKKKYMLVLQSAPTKSSWRSKAQYRLRKLSTTVGK